MPDEEKYILSWAEFFVLLDEYDKAGTTIYGVPKGGMIATGWLQEAKVVWKPEQANVILDDLIDSGATKSYYERLYPKAKFVALLDKKKLGIKNWVVWPWEKDHPMGEDTIQQNIVRMLQYLGEDVDREGLLDTPDRVVRSWQEIFAGYHQDLESITTTFESDSYDQIILLKDIELYSMCEHHMLPFFGKAHVAYIPQGPKGPLLGISKLARLVDMYSKRLQIQERIGMQVTAALRSMVNPLGSACIIEAEHLCMRMRGVNKQESKLTTSSLTGVFKDKPEARAELMQLIK